MFYKLRIGFISTLIWLVVTSSAANAQVKDTDPINFLPKNRNDENIELKFLNKWTDYLHSKMPELKFTIGDLKQILNVEIPESTVIGGN